MSRYEARVPQAPFGCAPALFAVLLLAGACLWPAAPGASAGTVWREDGSSGFENGTKEGTALRGADGAVVLDRGDLFGSGGSWRLFNPGPPAPRAMAGMAYDPVRKVSVLFGGNGVPNETWEYDSAANLWACYRTDPAPSQRYAFGMAYHSGAGAVVLFGGVTGGGNANDTWTYDAGSHKWTRKSPPAAPSGRYACGMAYDAASGLIVLFGGYGGMVARGDTWVYNLTADNWTLRTPSPSPSARYMHSMAGWPRLGLVALFGGYGKGDLWTYNASADAWTLEPAGALPGARSGALMAYDVTDDVMLLFGGFGSGTYLQETWYTPDHGPAEWAMLATANAPIGRDVPAGAYDSSTKKLVVFGGSPTFSPSPPVGDTWTLDYAQKRWTAMVPTARSGHSMAFDEGTGKAVMFGGRDNYESYKSDTWLFDAGKNLWSSATPATRPQPRYLASMAYDSANGVSVLFGGQWPVRGDTWTYNASADDWTNRTPAVSPPARYSSAMASDAFNGVCLLFGGGVAAGRVGDTWAYNTSTNAWTNLQPALAPSARSGHALAFDPVGRVAVLFGGNDSRNCADTWTYDYSANLWRNVTPPASPPARMGASLVYDGSRGLMVLYGGRGDISQYFNDTWVYSVRSNLWTMVNTPAAPEGRMLHSAAYDPKLNQTVLFGGGAGTSYRGEVWTFPESVGFRPFGRFVSAPLDTGGEAYFGTVRTNFTVPANTSLRIRLRTAQSAAALEAADFVGPDGTCSTWYEGGERVSPAQSPARWAQYCVEMETASRDRTPVLRDIRIGYNRMHRLTLYSPSGLEQWLGTNNITWNALDPDGDRLYFDVLLSRDGGATYPVALATNLTRSWLEWNTSTQPAGRSCRIKVVARDRDSEWPLSAEDNSSLNFVILRQNILPRAELLSPPSGTVIRGSGVDLAWTGSDDDRDPLAYYVVMDGVVHSRVEGTTLHAANLSNGLHRWWIIPNDGFGNGTCLSGKWTFTFNGNLPPCATLAAPADDSVVRIRSATLAWSGADGEGDRVEYAVFLNGRVLGATTSTSYEVGNLSNGTYEWTVVPSDEGGNGTCLSGAWRFTVKRNRAPDILLLHPMNGSTVGNATAALDWSGWDPEGDALTYTLELSDGAGFNVTRRLDARNTTLELLDRTEYTWRVAVSDGIDSVTSPGFTFRIRVNRPPVIHSVPVLGARPGRSYAYQVVATDPDPDALRYRLVEGPENMGMTPGGKVLWVPWSGQAGKTFRVAITVGDGELEERQEFTINVEKARQPSTASDPGPYVAAGLAAALVAGIAVLVILWTKRKASGETPASSPNRGTRGPRGPASGRKP